MIVQQLDTELFARTDSTVYSTEVEVGEGVAEGELVGVEMGDGDDVAIGVGVGVGITIGEAEAEGTPLMRTPLFQTNLPFDFTQV